MEQECVQGDELELQGNDVFNTMDIICVGNEKKQVKLRDLDPSGPHGENDHCEFDYFLVNDKCCLIGEITGRTVSKNIKEKYRSFRRAYETVTKLKLSEEQWRILGIPEDYLRNFRDVTEFRGFFIVACVEQFDVKLDDVPKVVKFYKSDWDITTNYANSLGSYAKKHFLSRFDMNEEVSNNALVLRKQENNLLSIPNRIIASGVPNANLYMFEVSPYEILDTARVFRRDELPSLTLDIDYQRPLIPAKIKQIRKNLLTTPDFVFPNSILVVLSQDCEYSTESERLIIPKTYGSIEIIDGQHRLFSYASDDVKKLVEDDCRILVTAIQFKTSSDEEVRKYNAQCFVEINMNQTKVSPDHLDAIAYDILGQVSSRALGAQVILRANLRHGSSLYGFFNTNQTSLGIVKARTILTAVKQLTNLNALKQISNAKSGNNLLKKQGYERLFLTEDDEDFEVLFNPEILIDKTVIVLQKYFGIVRKQLRYDWPERNSDNKSSLAYSKTISAFIRLLNSFIEEGLEWKDVEEEIEKIKNNILSLRSMTEYTSILFDPKDSKIPDARPRDTESARFLISNRKKPSSIQEFTEVN